MVSLGPFPYYLGSSRLCAQSPRFFWAPPRPGWILKKKNERKKSRFESGLEGSDGWMGGGGREEVGSRNRAPCSALKKFP